MRILDQDQESPPTVSTGVAPIARPNSPLRRTDSDRLRTKLFSKLGVQLEAASSDHKPLQLSPRSAESILGSARVTIPLNDHEVEDERDQATPVLWPFTVLFRQKDKVGSAGPASIADESPSIGSSFSSQLDEKVVSERSVDSATSAARKELKFNKDVAVCLIPMRDEYSKRIREHLWSSPAEMAANAQRNSVEFAAEGWDWRNVMEDENMYRCLNTNELIHPVHIEQPSSP